MPNYFLARSNARPQTNELQALFRAVGRGEGEYDKIGVGEIAQILQNPRTKVS